MEMIQELFVTSENLYTHLADIPSSNERDDFIQKINELLDARGAVINLLKEIEPNPVHGHPLEKQLIELDQGIRNRLLKVKMSITDDMKQLQVSKKSEQRYVNPYAAVRVMDGTFYDKKK